MAQLQRRDVVVVEMIDTLHHVAGDEAPGTMGGEGEGDEAPGATGGEGGG